MPCRATTPSPGSRIEPPSSPHSAAPPDVRAEALRRMWAHAAAGELTADYETVPLEAIGEAWRRQAESPNRKLVVVP